MTLSKDNIGTALRERARAVTITALIALNIAGGTVFAQPASDPCGSSLVNFIGAGVAAVTQIGPAIGALSFLIAFGMMGVSSSKEDKKKWKGRRNDALLYGVIGLLAGRALITFFTTTILGFSDSCLDLSTAPSSSIAFLAIVTLGNSARHHLRKQFNEDSEE